jgi:hypothetical protein
VQRVGATSEAASGAQHRHGLGSKTRSERTERNGVASSDVCSCAAKHSRAVGSRKSEHESCLPSRGRRRTKVRAECLRLSCSLACVSRGCCLSGQRTFGSCSGCAHAQLLSVQRTPRSCEQVLSRQHDTQQSTHQRVNVFMFEVLIIYFYHSIRARYSANHKQSETASTLCFIFVLTIQLFASCTVF